MTINKASEKGPSVDLGRLQAEFNAAVRAKRVADLKFASADNQRLEANSNLAKAQAALESGFRTVRG